MLDGVNLDAAFDQRGGALHRFDVLDPGFDDRVVGHVRSLELEAVVDRSGVERKSHLFARMQGSSRKAGWG